MILIKNYGALIWKKKLLKDQDSVISPVQIHHSNLNQNVLISKSVDRDCIVVDEPALEQFESITNVNSVESTNREKSSMTSYSQGSMFTGKTKSTDTVEQHVISNSAESQDTCDNHCVSNILPTASETEVTFTKQLSSLPCLSINRMHDDYTLESDEDYIPNADEEYSKSDEDYSESEESSLADYSNSAKEFFDANNKSKVKRALFTIPDEFSRSTINEKDVTINENRCTSIPEPISLESEIMLAKQVIYQYGSPTNENSVDYMFEREVPGSVDFLGSEKQSLDGDICRTLFTISEESSFLNDDEGDVILDGSDKGIIQRQNETACMSKRTSLTGHQGNLYKQRKQIDQTAKEAISFTQATSTSLISRETIPTSSCWGQTTAFRETTPTSCSSRQSTPLRETSPISSHSRQMTPLRETTPTSCCSRQMTPIRQMNPPFLTKGSSSVSHYLSENTTETKVTFHILCSKVNGRISSTLHKGIYTGSILSYGVDNKMAIVFGESENLDNHECNMRDDNIEEAPCVLTWKSDKFHCTVGHCLSVGTLTGTGILMPSFDNNTVAALSFSTMSHLVDANNTKRNYCMFCDKKLTSISRHFLLVHSDQPDIARINSMDKKSRERCEALRKLRTKSNNYFNLNVCPEDRLVVRKSLKTNIEDYLPCPSCSGLFAPKNLAKHNRECSGRVANRFPVVKVAKLSAKYIPEDKPLETHLVDTLIKDLRDGKESTVIKNDYALRLYAKNDTLIKDLRDGKESTVIKNDYALRLYAKKLAVGHRSSKHHSANNRQILRRCARLLIEIQKIDCTVKNFEDVLRPEKYNLIMQSIYNMCIIKDCSNFEFGIPTIANQMNNYLKELPLLLQTEYLKQGYSEDSLQIQRLKIFLLVHEREFNVYISKSANTTMIKNRFKKKFVLPTTEDIVLFNDYIKKLASDSFSVLNNNGFDVSSYATLQKCVLLQLLIFNRRRVGETSRMTVELYLARERVNESQYKYMNRLEIMLAKHYHRMELLGKRERRLPMLLNPKQIEYLNLLLKYRKDMGIDSSNEFLFAIPNKSGHLDASVVIRQFSNECGAVNPSTLRGTLLRKQVATLSQMLHLDENEMQQLADYMGHDFNVHKTYYRKPAINQQTTVLAKFFMAIGDTDVSKFKGKSIDQLQVVVPETNDETDDFSESDVEDKNSALPESGVSQVSAISKELEDGISKEGNNEYAIATEAPKKSGKIRTKIMWTPNQKKIVYDKFAKFLKPTSGYPSLQLCHEVSQKYKQQLKGRDGRSLYAWVQGEQRRLLKCSAI